jgi:uncharacterized protein with von Willebrand factor type A (vWA) domain
MSERQPTTASLFTQVDISAASTTGHVRETGINEAEPTRLLRDILTAQDRQNELLEELVGQLGAAVNQMASGQRQRAQELAQWREANPRLASQCRVAAEALSRVQTEFLNTLTEEVETNAEVLADGEFMLSEFVDRFGPRLAHLNGVLQVLAQLGSPPANSAS